MLRASGMLVTVSETIDVMRALSLVKLADRSIFKRVLRAVLVKRSDELELFEKLFEEFWAIGNGKQAIDSMRQIPGSMRSAMADPAASQGLQSSVLAHIREGSEDVEDDGDAETGDIALAVYSPLERLGKKDFKLSWGDIPEIRRGLKLFARAFATKPGRRYVPAKRGGIDFSRTFRANISTGGGMMVIRRKRRELSKLRLVVLCDISGSMDEHSETLIKILHLAQNKIGNTRTYAFSTRLVDLTHLLRGKSMWGAAQEISGRINLWNSGTRIGSALQTLLREHSTVLTPQTVLVIISDGWEVGDVELLKRNLMMIRQRVGKIVWLNPLADEQNYTPSTVGMQAALPYLDALAGLNILTRQNELQRVQLSSSGIFVHR